MDTTEHPTWTANVTDHTAPIANEDPTITVTFPMAQVTEGDGVISGQATVSVPANVTNALTINLSASDSSWISLGLGTATIAAGSNSTTFSFGVNDNTEMDGDKTILVFGQAVNYTSGAGSILIKDND